MLPLLQDPAAAITLFAPTDEAWATVDPSHVNLSDRETLQAVLTFLVAQVGALWGVSALGSCLCGSVGGGCV